MLLDSTEVTRIIKDFERVRSYRVTWESHWQQVADLVYPLRTFLVIPFPGNRRMVRIFDSTAPECLDEFAAAMDGLLMNPAIKWFNLRMQDDAMDSRDDVRQWLDEVVNRMFSVINSTDLNFNTQAHEVFIDIGAFGTGVMFVRDGIDRLHIKAIALNQAYIKENEASTIDTMHRWNQRMSARKIAQRFGTANLPDNIVRALQNDQEQEFDILHSVFPRTDRTVNFNGKMDKPFASTWIELSSKTVISVGGFNEFPYLTPRWSKTVEEPYGRSPAMKVLPTIQMVNEMKRTNLRGAQLQVNPPIIVEDEDQLRPVRTLPSSLIIKRPGGDPNFPKPFLTNARADIGEKLLEPEQEAIRKGFFLHLFEAPEGDRMTTLEVMEKSQSKMQKLTPHVFRIQKEFLGPLINRIFNIMMRAGAFPPPPDDIRGHEFDIDYVSPLALSQKASDISAIVHWMGAMGPFIQLNPSIMDNMDQDQMARYVAKLGNVPQKLFRSFKDVMAMRDQQNQLRQQAQLAQLAQAQAGAAKDAGKATKDFNDAQST